MSAFTVGGATATAGPHLCRTTSNIGALSADIEARAELMEGYRVCAKCGADHFTQRPCRRSEDGHYGPTASEAVSLASRFGEGQREANAVLTTVVDARGADLGRPMCPDTSFGLLRRTVMDSRGPGTFS